MNAEVSYVRNAACVAELCAHLVACDGEFYQRLSTRVSIHDYATKLFSGAERFEAWAGNDLVGLVASYHNDPRQNSTYISNVSVLPSWQGLGIASQLIKQCVELARNQSFSVVLLSANAHDPDIIGFYESLGFGQQSEDNSSVLMQLELRQ